MESWFVNGCSPKPTKRRNSRLFLALMWAFSLFLMSPPVQAQRSEFQGARRHVATVIFCGLGGAVLGLSTLSFYGQPQEHTGNIYTGLAVGLVLGTAYVLSVDTNMESLSATSSFHRTKPQLQLAEFRDHFREPRSRPSQLLSVPVAAYSWTF